MNTLPTKTSLISIDLILEQAKVSSAIEVADLGCGRSTFFLYALSKLVGKNGIVNAVDILPEVIESLRRDIAHHNIQGIKVITADIENQQLPLPEASQKAVFLINTLSQSSDSLGMLTHATRLVSEGGRLIIVDWNDSASPIGPSQDRRIPLNSIIEMLSLLGHTKLDQFEAGPYHYGITVKF